MDIHTALFQANLLYGVEIEDDTFEEIALICHKLIGNKNTKLYHYVAHIDPETLSVELPCNFEVLEAVTYDWEDWNYTSNHLTNGDLNSSFTEQYIESKKAFTHPLYHSGKYAEYHQVGNTLYFKYPYGRVHILYKGEVLNDDGLPDVNDKEIMAIATYVAYVVMYKEGLKTKNGGIMQMATDLQRKAMYQMDEARTPVHVTQNEMNDVLEVKSSWNRKVHNKSYKPLM